MLPTAHVEFTWAALNLLQRRTGTMLGADYRWIAVAAVASDLLDKPLALTIYRDRNAALFWGHNLWFHGLLWLLVLAWLARRRRLARGLPYLMAFSGHLIADRMWGFRASLLYPLGPGEWHTWVHVGGTEAMWRAYLQIIRDTPLLVVFELVGLILLAWLVVDRGLWRGPALRRFLRYGIVGSDPASPANASAQAASPIVASQSEARLPPQPGSEKV